METLQLTTQWDKTFPQSDKVKHQKITFHNRYGLPWQQICICLKRQKVNCLPLQSADRLGQSKNSLPVCMPRQWLKKDFCAAVDFLSVQDNVDCEKIGIVGICGWGGMAINAAAMDTRIKATVAVTMYDMTRVNAKGYFDGEDSEEARYEKKKY